LKLAAGMMLERAARSWCSFQWALARPAPGQAAAHVTRTVDLETVFFFALPNIPSRFYLTGNINLCQDMTCRDPF
jgi:hypothetical protein